MYCVAQKRHIRNYHNHSEEVAGKQAQRWPAKNKKHNHHNMNMKMRSRAARLRAIEQELLEATYLESKWVTFNQCVEDSGSFKANGKTDCKWRSIATVSCTGAGCSIGRTKMRQPCMQIGWNWPDEVHILQQQQPVGYQISFDSSNGK